MVIWLLRRRIWGRKNRRRGVERSGKSVSQRDLPSGSCRSGEIELTWLVCKEQKPLGKEGEMRKRSKGCSEAMEKVKDEKR